MPDITFKSRFGHGLLALALLLAGPAIAQTRTCDRHLKPVPGGIGYALREGPPRCEGLYQSTVSSVRLQVVSILRGGLAFDLGKHQSLEVRAPESPLLAGQPLRVRAVALPLKTYYRMDAVLPPEGVLQWPLHDVVGRVGLPASKIGVYGWIEDDQGQIFVPLSVTPQGDAAVGAAPAPIRIIVRSAVDLDRLAWRTASEDGQVLDKQDYGEAPLRAGRAVVLTLAAGTAAVLTVDIAGLPAQSDTWTKLRLRVLRPGSGR